MTGVLNHLIDCVFSLPMFVLAGTIIVWRLVFALVLVFKVLDA